MTHSSLSNTLLGHDPTRSSRLIPRIDRDELEQFFRGCGWVPHFVEGDEPEAMHRLMAVEMETRKS